MGRLSTAAGARSNLATPEQWVIDWFKGGAETLSGVNVTEDTALHYGPFFAGVRLIAEDVASLPFPVYRRLQPKGKERVDHSVARLLNDQPNEAMSAQAFRETLQGLAMMWGGGFAEIVRHQGSGEAIAMWPLRSDRMKVKLKGRKLAYHYEDHQNGVVKTFLPDEIFHVYGLGGNGVKGYSLVELARQSIGSGVAAERYGAGFFGNAARPSGVLTHPGVVSEKAKKNMRDSWEKLHKGPSNSQRIAILEEGVTWEALGVPPGDAQFLETRRFNVVEMARWLRLPPHKLGELDRATWNNIESQQIDYVSSALRVWLTRWESTVRIRLFTALDRRSFFAEHIIEGLLRGDAKTRFESYRIGREIGLYSADDLAEMENRNPLPDGKGEVYFVPLNWVPAPSPDDENPFRSGGQRTRSVESRRRIARKFRPVLADVDLRIAKVERVEVGKLVRKHFRSGRRAEVALFIDDLEELYRGDIADRTVEQWSGPLAALAAAIGEEAALELSIDDEDVPDLGSWASDYTAAHSAYRVNSVMGRIRAIALDHADDTEALSAAVSTFMDEQVAERPERAAAWEATQMSNSAARETWRSGGAKKVKWSAAGDTCPYCKKLDGKTVSIADTFAAAGDEIDADEQTLTVSHDTFAPPVHGGCDCSISVG